MTNDLIPPIWLRVGLDFPDFILKHAIGASLN